MFTLTKRARVDEVDSTLDGPENCRNCCLVAHAAVQITLFLTPEAHSTKRKLRTRVREREREREDW